MDMKRIRIFILFLIILSSAIQGNAQNVSTQGKEFWLSFMHNGFRDHTDGGWTITQVLISAKRDCSGTVMNPLTGWSEPFSVSANSITTVAIPESEGYHMGNMNEVVTEKAIKVVASDTISVYCTNIAHVSFDASFVLPTESLGNDYIIQCCEQSISSSSNAYVTNNETSAFLIVATENNTEIDITPSTNTLGGHEAGTTFSVTLDAGQTYMVRSNRISSARDLSGTRVTANDCKKIAIFNGNTLTCVPTNMGNGFDHVFEQAMPLRSWGKRFVVTSSKNRNRDFFKITSSADNNHILKNGMPFTTLNANQSDFFQITQDEASCFIEAEQPVAVYLYNNSSYDQSYSGGLGDPSMVWIAPVEQKIDEVTFSTFDHPNINIEVHYVNIIVSTDDINKVYFDGQQISPLEFRTVNGNTAYSYVKKQIEHNAHHIQCVNGFNAHVYGFGNAKGYAYLVGSTADDLSTSLVINDLVVKPNDVFQYCIDEPVVFSAEVNHQEYQLLWDFGDGTTSHNNPETHTYHNRQVYQASLIVTTDESGCEASASDTTRFFVDVTQQYAETEHDDICTGEYYTGFGFNNVLIVNDTILGRLQDNPNNPKCPDSLLVYITAWPKYEDVQISDSRCWTGEPAVYNDHGFYFPITEPGISTHTLELQTIHGCDSIVTLTLEVGDFEIHATETHYLCYDSTPSFTWDVNGETYHEDGFYADTLPSGDCYAIYSLELYFLQVPEETHLYDTTCTAYDWEISGQTYHLEASGDYRHDDDLAPYPCVKTTWLHLTLAGTVENPTPETVTACDSFVWHGNTYTESNPYYTTVLQTPLGCDSIVHLNLTIRHTPSPSNIRIPDDPYNYQDGDTIPVITNTEFFSFQYDFYVEDLNAHMDEWDSCVWNISKPSWRIETSPEGVDVQPNCRVYVADRDEDPVELNCTIYNSHCEPYSITRKFYLKSSFFGLDDHETYQARFDVVPNPNNGQMQLHFEHLTGKVNIKVYDMHGSLIDQFETYNNMDYNNLQYNLQNHKAGIYFFVATAREGTLAQKVVVRKE